jgi:hypothetical protein
MERRLFWPPFLLTDRRLELKEIVQLGEHEKKPNLLTGASENHDLAPLGGTSLNQHQRAESSRIHVAGAREIDHQATNTLGHFLQESDGRFPDFDPGIKSEGLGCSHTTLCVVRRPHCSSFGTELSHRVQATR